MSGPSIIVCGGRDFTDRDWLWAGMDRLYGLIFFTTVIEGGARGADRLAADWVCATNTIAGTAFITHTKVPAQWDTHGKRAGYLRNVAMADLCPDYVLVAPGGAGTAMMVKIAKERGIPLIFLDKMDVKRSASSTTPQRIT